MNRHRTSLFTLITLIALVITPVAVAEIYKCDGPDGPIYSDRKCGLDAANVELKESSGLSGVNEQDKADLAEKKLERELANPGDWPHYEASRHRKSLERQIAEARAALKELAATLAP